MSPSTLMGSPSPRLIETVLSFCLSNAPDIVRINYDNLAAGTGHRKFCGWKRLQLISPPCFALSIARDMGRERGASSPLKTQTETLPKFRCNSIGRSNRCCRPAWRQLPSKPISHALANTTHPLLRRPRRITSRLSSSLINHIDNYRAVLRRMGLISWYSPSGRDRWTQVS